MRKASKFLKSGKNKALALVLSLSIMVSGSYAFGGGLICENDEEEAITREYGDYVFTKVSNPTSGVGEPDGINTNDITGYDANRLNSYAWAVASRGDYIYIGTNRTLFGSALNALTNSLKQLNPNLSQEKMGKAIELVTGGDVPVNLEEEDYIPQIIKFDVNNGNTEVVYKPATHVGEDGLLYYTDKDGNIIPRATVTSETASFRSVIEFKGNLYFGSLGTDMLQLVRVDEEDNAEVVFQTIGLVSSLRACEVYDDGDCETVYFGGQDTTYTPWLLYRKNHPGEAYPLPIVIRYLDPDTAGTAEEDWSGLIADYSDFGKYAYATVYSAGGGNVWDLCSYNGNLYLILAYDGGWAMFRGEKGGDNPNKFGWTWTEIVGDDGQYPLAMNEEVAELNEEYAEEFGGSEFLPALNGTGLLESTATPYVYNGKMYIGSFDNATTIQSQTVIKGLLKVMALRNLKTGGPTGPTLEQIFAPIYELFTHPQHVWVMDENEEIAPVEGLNELLEGTTNDYVWRFVEYNGKLYTGTFDSSSAFNYFLDFNLGRILSLLKSYKDELPENLADLFDGEFSKDIETLLPDKEDLEEDSTLKGARINAIKALAVATVAYIEDFLNGEISFDELVENVKALETISNLLGKLIERIDIEEDAPDESAIEIKARLEQAKEMIDWLREYFDIEGLEYWAGARAIAKNAESGFDIFVTEDGENWEVVTDNGLDDPYNYGARTFTVCNNELYVGTANPYYGAQLWKIGGDGVCKDPVFTKDPEAKQIEFNGEENELVTAGECEGGVIYYALSDDEEIAPEFDPEDEECPWSTEVPTAKEPGNYYVWYMIVGDELYRDTEPVCLHSMILFNDVTADSKYYFKPVYWAADLDITNGYLAEGGLTRTFGPERECTREEMIVFIWRLAGKPEATITESPFSDVPATGEYYSRAVLWAYENGITKGYTSGKKKGTFGVGATVTREDSVTFLYRLAGKPEVETTESAFTDVETGKYYTKPVIWAAEAGITKGYTSGAKKGTFGVGENCLREHIITFLYRF